MPFSLQGLYGEYVMRMSGEEIAKELGVTRQDVCNTLKRAMGKLYMRTVDILDCSPFEAALVIADILQVDDDDYENFFKLFPVSYKLPSGEKLNIRMEIKKSI